MSCILFCIWWRLEDKSIRTLVFPVVILYRVIKLVVFCQCTEMLKHKTNDDFNSLSISFIIFFHINFNTFILTFILNIQPTVYAILMGPLIIEG